MFTQPSRGEVHTGEGGPAGGAFEGKVTRGGGEARHVPFHSMEREGRILFSGGAMMVKTKSQKKKPNKNLAQKGKIDPFLQESGKGDLTMGRKGGRRKREGE